ncbi:fukutin [Trichonephila clavipes]|nr:fukutin [Trichonephila clavipes]
MATGSSVTQNYSRSQSEVLRDLHKFKIISWFRECGVISYTTDVDFGMWADDVSSVEELIEIIKKNNPLKLKGRFGFDRGHQSGGLRTSSGPRENFAVGSKRVIYPPFTLCSADLLGEKVLVPCNTEKIITTEYGPNWTERIREWDWTSSFCNKGPEIYWDSNRKKNVYQFF